MARDAQIERKTNETEIVLGLALDGSGQAQIDTGVGFFDHMLDLLARHSGFDLEVSAKGDLATGAHHTVEDVGIVLGQALDEALGDRSGITRYGDMTVPMDECLASCVIDISGRPYCSFAGELPGGLVGDFDTELTEEFFRAFTNNAKLALHIMIDESGNAHHMIEAAFKAFARALRQAVATDPTQKGVPSTKGML